MKYEVCNEIAQIALGLNILNTNDAFKSMDV